MDSVRESNGNRDYSISCVRFIAMCLIFICHIMQRNSISSVILGVQIEWAFWFNVGVQMFLFISGYLYGTRSKIDTISFYKKAFPKILIDYYVFIVIMLVIIGISPLLDIGIKGTLKLLTFSGTVPGFGHLWFIPTILFCYLITPILFDITCVIDKKRNISFLSEALVLFLIVHAVIMLFFKSFTPAWINCYCVGMVYSNVERRNGVCKTAFNIGSAFMCCLLLIVQFGIDYFLQGELSMPLALLYEQINDYGHVALGIVIVLFIRHMIKLFRTAPRVHHILNWSDKYSYDVYLVHHVFIQSVFACQEYISVKYIALPLAIIMTIIFSFVINFISRQIRKFGRVIIN